MPSLIPASRVEVFDVVAPAGTQKAAPLEVATAFAPGELVGVEVRIPDGAAGLVGFQLLYAHGQAIPSTAAAWIVGNDDTFEVDTTGQPNGGHWSVNVYNLDSFDHALHVRYYVADFRYLGNALADARPTVPVLG